MHKCNRQYYRFKKRVKVFVFIEDRDSSKSYLSNLYVVRVVTLLQCLFSLQMSKASCFAQYIFIRISRRVDNLLSSTFATLCYEQTHGKRTDTSGSFNISPVLLRKYYYKSNLFECSTRKFSYILHFFKIFHLEYIYTRYLFQVL